MFCAMKTTCYRRCCHSSGRGECGLRYYDTLKKDFTDRGITIPACDQDMSWKKLEGKAADRVNW